MELDHKSTGKTVAERRLQQLLTGPEDDTHDTQRGYWYTSEHPCPPILLRYSSLTPCAQIGPILRSSDAIMCEFPQPCISIENVISETSRSVPLLY